MRSIASDLLRHQIWPLAFCRGRHVLYIGASQSQLTVWLTPGHFIKPRCTTRQRETIRLTCDHRCLPPPLSLSLPQSLSPNSLTYLLTVGLATGRQCNYDTTSCKLFDELTDDPGSHGGGHLSRHALPDAAANTCCSDRTWR